ncbi:MAG: MltA domain-containing protein [Planctomycetota bacterium]
MKQLVLPLLLVFAAACRTSGSGGPDYGRELPAGAPPLIKLAPGQPHPDLAAAWLDRADLKPALERSISWTSKRYSTQFFPAAGISHDLALASLRRFHDLLESCRTQDEFRQAIDAEFDFYKSAGWDGRGGGVLFTGYCTPVLDGSTKPSAQYRYPLYALPPDLVKAEDGTILGQQTARGIEPYPTRREIERSGMLEHQGLELIWLRDPLDAFIAHVNGSAFVRTPDGTELRFGYAGKNGQPYASMGGELVKDGRISKEALSLGTLRAWAAQGRVSCTSTWRATIRTCSLPHRRQPARQPPASRCRPTAHPGHRQDPLPPRCPHRGGNGAAHVGRWIHAVLAGHARPGHRRRDPDGGSGGHLPRRRTFGGTTRGHHAPRGQLFYLFLKDSPLAP